MIIQLLSVTANVQTSIAKSPTSDTSLKGPRDGNAYWLYFGRETSNKTGSYKIIIIVTTILMVK